MAKQKIFKILSILAILFFSISSQAAGTCLSDKSDISADMKKIHEKLAVITFITPNKNITTGIDIRKLYDDQQLKVDRTDKLLKQVNAVGIIKPSLNDINHATAILISPCHVLVNAHAVPNIQAKKSLASVYVSIGQSTCESPNEFAYNDMLGKVIAIGDPSDSESGRNHAHDYAIIKLSQSINDIELPIVSEEPLHGLESLISVGFPSSTVESKSGFRYPTASFSKPTIFNGVGTFRYSNTKTEDGASGSGMFFLDKNEDGTSQFVLAGIIVGSSVYGGLAIQTAQILQHLKTSNYKAYKEIEAAIKTNSCSFSQQ